MIWLAIAGFFLIGEIFVAGTFFLLPFGISALLAMLLSIVGAPIWLQWVTFVVVGIGLFVVMLRWGQRFQAEQPLPVGVGADRLVGEVGLVTGSIPSEPTQSGRVQIGAEDWAAESVGNVSIEAGAVVEVIKVRGTRVIVSPVEVTANETIKGAS